MLSEIKGESIDPHLLLLLRSGHLPDAKEKTSILTTIEDYGVQLDSLDAELSQLKTIMNQLETRRSNLELQISYQGSLLSPIRRLPNELLGEILLYAARGRVNVCSPQSDVWNFEKVCKKWRDISLSSEIWSSIDVSLESMVPWKPGTPTAMVAHLVELCLRRSRDRSLSVKFEEIGSPVNFKDIFDILSPYSNRWEELFLSLSMLPVESPILDYGLTRLNFLRLSGAYRNSTPLDTFKHAQQLQRLHLYSVPKPSRSLLLPWSQITDFKAIQCKFRTGEFVDILKAMPNVVRFLSRWNKGINKIDVAGTNRIHLRRLKILELVTLPYETYAILQLLTFPSLTDLTIASGNLDSSVSQYTPLADSVISAIDRSSCQLTSLSLHFVDSACVARILPYTQWVEHLNLEGIQSPEIVLRQLVQPSLWVPHLRSFSLECAANQGVTCIGPLVSMIRSRSCPDEQGAGGHLKTVDLTLREKRGIDAFTAILQPLGIETGVGIAIHVINQCAYY